MKIWITAHCKDRFKERISLGVNTDVVDILKLVSSGKDITNKVLDDAPRYILYLHEKYGEFGQKIIKNGDIIFILKRTENVPDGYTVLTCYKDTNYLSQFINSAMPRKEIYMQIKIAKMKNNSKKN